MPASEPHSTRVVRGARRLRRQVLRALVVAMLLPTLALATLYAVLEYRSVEHEQRDRLRLAARLTAGSIDQFMQAHVAATALVASSDAARRGQADLQSLQGLYPAFVTTLSTDAAGMITGTAPAGRMHAGASRSVADRDYYRVPARQGGSYITDAFRGRGLGRDPLVAVASPIHVDGAFAGVIEGSIHVDAFTRLHSRALRERGQSLLLVDRAGRVIHASAGLPYRFLQPVGHAPFMARDRAVDGDSAVRVDRDVFDGAGAWVAWSRLRSGWRVVVFEPRNVALSGAWRRSLQSLLLALAVAVVVGIAGWQMRGITRAVRYTLGNVRAIAAGQRSPAVPLHDVPVELQPVARQVVQLATRLRRANEGLQGALARQRQLADALARANERLEDTVRVRTAELESANQALRRLAGTDALTGVLNVRGLQDCERALTDPHGRLQAQAAVIAFDVDWFKRYNDRYGHPAGDQALKRVAAAAQAAARGGADRVARVGGEEFLLVLPDADAGTAGQVAERLRAGVHALGIPHADGDAGQLSVSVGVSHGPAGDTLEAVTVRADRALYRAKAAGRNRVAT